MDTIRRANAVHPITALQSEYSLWTRDPEPAVLPLTARTRHRVRARTRHSGHGFLTGTIRSTEQFDDDDFGARPIPASPARTSSETCASPTRSRPSPPRPARRPAQVAIAWLLTKGDDIAPIPGTKRVARLEENIAADGVELTAEQIEQARTS